MAILNIMCGIPGSGKSTYIQDHINFMRDTIVSRDAIRFSLITPGIPYFSKEKEVFKLFCENINKAGENPDIKTVWADATHITEGSRRKLINNINIKLFDEINFICLVCSVELCLSRNACRTGLSHVPEDVITRMAEQYTLPSKDIVQIIPNLGFIQIVDEEEFFKYDMVY